MPDNAHSEREKTLSSKQQQAINHIIAGIAQGEIAKKLAINEKTLWRWKQLPEFQEGLRQAEDVAFNEAISLLKRMMKVAVFTLARNMSEKTTPYVQVMAASKLLDSNLELQKIAQLEDKIKLFESLLKESGIK